MNCNLKFPQTALMFRDGSSGSRIWVIQTKDGTPKATIDGGDWQIGWIPQQKGGPYKNSDA